jgi:hypothetical protein
MCCIIILENLRSPNSTVLVHFCRVLKIKHTANKIFAVCFIETHGKGDGQQMTSLAAIFAVCLILGTRQRAWFAVCPGFAVGLLARRTAYLLFAVCAGTLPCACSRSTRQTLHLPCARCLAHGKRFGTRQTQSFR